MIFQTLIATFSTCPKQTSFHPPLTPLFTFDIWGTSSNLIWKPFTVNSGESNFALLMKLPREFEIRNTTTGSGYLRTLNVDFTMDEALLNRAEAEIMLGQNDIALLHYHFSLRLSIFFANCRSSAVT